METLIAASIQLRDLIETDIQVFRGVGNFSSRRKEKITFFVMKLREENYTKKDNVKLDLQGPRQHGFHGLQQTHQLLKKGF